MSTSQKCKFIFILIVVTSFAYISSLGGPFIWDDEQFITSNQYVQQFDLAKIFTTSTTAGAGVVSNYYRPLSTLSFAIDAKIWGQNPFGFHVTNLSLHMGAGIVLFLLLLEVGLGQWGSFFISLFFLIHPIQTEAVTYINSRGDSMYTFFLFGSLWVFARAMKSKNTWFFACSLLLYLLSILSKETAMAAFPLFFVLILINMLKIRQNFAQSIQLYAKPIFVAILAGIIAVGYFALRLSILNFENTLNYYGSTIFYSTHLWVRIFTFARVLWIYIGLLAWPYPLHMERSVGLVTSPFSWEVWGIGGLICGVLYIAFWEIRKRQTGIILFGFILSTCLLVPISGIIPINGILYEHWLYVPMIGVGVMVYGIMQFLILNFQLSIKSQNTKHKILNTFYKILISFAILLASLYIVLTIRQNNIWSDPVGFYRYTLQFAPHSARLHNNLAMTLAARGDSQGAMSEYRKALMLDQNYPQIYNNLGNVQMQVGDYKDAEVNLKKALKIAPGFAVAKTNLIRVYLLTKQYDKARSLSGNDPQVGEIIRQLQNR